MISNKKLEKKSKKYGVIKLGKFDKIMCETDICYLFDSSIVLSKFYNKYLNELDIDTRRSDLSLRNVVSGPDYSFIIGPDKYLYCYGSNDYGQLGIGKITDKTLEMELKSYLEKDKFSRYVFKPYKTKYNEFIDIICGNKFTYAITKDGNIYGCGRNDKGQLGFEKNQKIIYEFTLIPFIELILK